MARKSPFRRSSAANLLDSGGSSGDSSRRASVADASASRRPTLSGLALRLSSRSKRSNSLKEVDDGTESPKLWEAILTLPDEITSEIFCYLSLSDIFALRQSSRSVYTYLQSHAGPITRTLLLQRAYERTDDYDGQPNEKRAKHLYNYIHTIYPPPQPCTSFNHLLRMLKRENQVNRMLQVLTNWLQMKVYVLPFFKKCDNFNPYKFKLIRRFRLAAWTVYHFLERYRFMLVSEHPNHPPKNPQQSNQVGGCYTCNRAVRDSLWTYPANEIIPAYHFFDLLQQHLDVLSRAVTARVMRARKAPTNAELVQLIVLGGIPELSKMSLLKGSANSRIEVIGNFVDKVASAAVQQRIRSNGSLSSSQAEGPSSFDDLVAPLETPFALIHHNTISALPLLENLVVGTEEWIIRMYYLVGAGDQICSSWGMVMNILGGKSEKKQFKDKTAAGSVDSDLDFLVPSVRLEGD